MVSQSFSPLVSARTLLALGTAALMLVAGGCDDEPSDPETENDRETFELDDGTTLIVSGTDQPLDFTYSLIAVAGFGKQAPEALEQIGYTDNRAVWDDRFEAAVLDESDSWSALVALEAATNAHVLSDGAVLTESQVVESQRLIDWILSGDVRTFGGTEITGTEYIDSVIPAHGLRVAADNLEHRPADVEEFLTGLDLSDSQVDCTAEFWNSDDGWRVGHRLGAGLGLPCTDEEIAAAWEEVVSSLENADWSDGVDLSALDRISTALRVADHHPETLEPGAHDRLQGIVDRAYKAAPDDPWTWLHGYYSFQRGVEQPTVTPPMTDAAREVLLHFASRGTPEISIEEAR